MRRACAFLAVGFSLYATPACVAQTMPSAYSAKPIKATVFDHETGNALEGVVVVAVWELKAISGRGPRPQVSEVVTDSEGRFEIPGWGPKPRPVLTEFQADSPYLLLFKSQYTPVRLHNAPRKDFARLRALTGLSAAEVNYRGGLFGDPAEPVQEAVWDGMVLRLVRFKGTPEEWFKTLDWISTLVAFEDAKHTPRFYRALAGERDYFKRHPTNPSLVSPGTLNSLFVDIEGRIELSKERSR